jgi:hypothetical protein
VPNNRNDRCFDFSKLGWEFGDALDECLIERIKFILFHGFRTSLHCKIGVRAFKKQASGGAFTGDSSESYPITPMRGKFIFKGLTDNE